MPSASLPEFLDLKASALDAERAEASMGSASEGSAGLLGAAAEWLVREAVARRSAVPATTISTSVRLADPRAEGPYRLLGRQTYVGATSAEWTVDVETGDGRTVAHVEVALSLRDDPA